jgi:hypothetical protein
MPTSAKTWAAVASAAGAVKALALLFAQDATSEHH